MVLLTKIVTDIEKDWLKYFFHISQNDNFKMIFCLFDLIKYHVSEQKNYLFNSSKNCMNRIFNLVSCWNIIYETISLPIPTIMYMNKVGTVQQFVQNLMITPFLERKMILPRWISLTVMQQRHITLCICAFIIVVASFLIKVFFRFRRNYVDCYIGGTLVGLVLDFLVGGRLYWTSFARLVGVGVAARGGDLCIILLLISGFGVHFENVGKTCWFGGIPIPCPWGVRHRTWTACVGLRFSSSDPFCSLYSF